MLMDMSKKRVCTAFLITAVITGISIAYGNAYEAQTQPLPFPPYRSEDKTDARKVAVSEKLSLWVRKTLKEKNADVAVLARRGSKFTRHFDSSGFAHTSFAVRVPEQNDWVTFNLFSDPATKRRQDYIRLATLEDFYYGQTGYEEDTLILLPSPPLQGKILQGFLSGKYQQLFFTDRYNLLSNPYTSQSLNCTKWLVMNIYAAKIGAYDHQEVLLAMKKDFREQEIRPPLVYRLAVRFMSNIRTDEFPDDGIIRTISVASLLGSDLFEETIQYPE